MSSYPPNRAFYRLRFPVPERPRFEGGAATWPVYDCSETGLRCLIAPDTETPAIGDAVEGTVHFARGEEVPVEGTVVWARPGHVGINLDPDHRIPFRVLLAEQRHIRAKYPDFPL